MAIWPWYGGLAKGWLYGAAEFLSGQDYKNVLRWADLIAARPAVKRGRMVNRTSGGRRASCTSATTPATSKRRRRTRSPPPVEQVSLDSHRLLPTRLLRVARNDSADQFHLRAGRPPAVWSSQ
jgi:hypothetical protein